MPRPEDILVLREANPFVPFHLRLSDGRTLCIENRDFVWVFKNRVHVAIPSGAGRPLTAKSVSLSCISSALRNLLDSNRPCPKETPRALLPAAVRRAGRSWCGICFLSKTSGLNKAICLLRPGTAV